MMLLNRMGGYHTNYPSQVVTFQCIREQVSKFRT